MISQPYIEGGACLVLLIFLLWKEGQRQDKSHLAGRVAATVLAVVALAGMVLPLRYYRQVKALPVRAVVPHPGPLPKGVVAVDWQRRLTKGERCIGWLLWREWIRWKKKISRCRSKQGKL